LKGVKNNGDAWNITSDYFNVCGSLFPFDPSAAKAAEGCPPDAGGAEKGDKVVTIGGLHGIVDSIDESKVVIKTGDNTRLTFDRRAITEASAE
jgi:hypothetical protein